MLKLSARRKNSGVLLLEVLITVSLLGVGLTVILQAFSASIGAIRTAQQYTRAAFLAEDKLSQIKQEALQGDDIAAGQESGEFSEENKDFSWESEINPLEDTSLNEAKITVSWQQKDRENEVFLTTYLKSK